jgi:hypothetical protein
MPAPAEPVVLLAVLFAAAVDGRGSVSCGSYHGDTDAPRAEALEAGEADVPAILDMPLELLSSFILTLTELVRR